MSFNVDAINPCLEFEKNIQKGLSVLNGLKVTMGPMKDAMADITEAGARIDGNLVGDVGAYTLSGLNASLASLDTLSDQVEGLTGSCLKSVSGPLKDIAKNAVANTTALMGAASEVANVSDLVDSFGSMTDTFFDSAFSPVTGILNKVTGMDSLVQGLGIENIIGGLDDLLGCAGEGSDCGYLIDAGTIDGYFDEINSFITEFALTPEGTIDLANIMDLADIGADIAESIDTNMNLLSDGTDELNIKAKELLSATEVNFIDDIQF